MTYSREELKSVVETIENLPTISKVGMKILELASDPEVSMSELSEAIHQDPSLAARVLKVANSPFYGMSRQVDSLQLALVILGINEVRNVALGLSLFNVVKSLSSHVTYDREKFWLHSAGCGIVSRILGRKLGFREEGTDFIVGLLHDVGKIIIDEYFGTEFNLIFNKTLAHETTMLEAEREFLGGSHDQVGGWVAEKWRLPETLCDAILYHHDLPLAEPWTTAKDPRLVSLSYVAEAFCEHYEVGWDGDTGYCDVRNWNAWEVLLSGQENYARDDIGVILNETLQAFSEARPHMLWE
ncbi:MAG: HDOD domain-containing protein [Candidatus Hydrogenedentota bacterium]|nr:MAG: HDOD domain-containing protein [Candidatus Hydrogenedentota bacterium]